jgi:hypothetical protein
MGGSVEETVKYGVHSRHPESATSLLMTRIARAPLIRLRHLLPTAVRLQWGEGYLLMILARGRVK